MTGDDSHLQRDRQAAGGLAIACATGGFKGIFVHGVLSAFEEAGLRAAAYAAASSSVIPAAYAAIGQARDPGLAYWQKGWELLQQPGTGMSGMVLAGIALAEPAIREHLFARDKPRFLIVTNAVAEEATAETQGPPGRRRGRQLLLDAARGRRDWVDRYLTLHLFDTAATNPAFRLAAENFAEVAYASSRMLHAWDVPAAINGRPYVDAYYTCHCPAVEVAGLGFSRVVAIATEPVLYRDIFQQEIVPESWQGVPIRVIRPDADPAALAVDYTTAAPDGMRTVFQHGWEKGLAFCRNL
jgi:hypothetical protein